MLESYRKIFALLERRERRQFCLLVVMSLVLGVVEAVGVLSVLPFIAIASDPSVIDRSALLSRAYELSGATSKNAFLITLGIGIFAIYMASVAFRAITFYALTRFAHLRAASLGTKLMRRFLAQQYAWFLGHHSAKLCGTVLSEVDETVRTSVVSGMRLIAYAAVAIVLVGMLMIVNLGAALVIGGVMAGAYAIVVFSVRRTLVKLGRERQRSNAARFAIAHEAFGGIKQAKLLHLEPSYLGRFKAAVLDLSDARARTALLSETPRHALEGLVFGSMLGLVLWVLAFGNANLTAALPLLAVYAVAGIKLAPVLQKLYTALAIVRADKPNLDALHAALTVEMPEVDLPNDNGPPITLRHALELHNIRYTFPEAAQPALDGLTLRIEANTTVGIVGPTGAGKTTVIDVILGLLEPDSGTMRVDDVPINRDNVRGWQRSVGYVPQSFFHLDDTIAANIALGVPHDRVDYVAVERAARVANLHDFVTSLPQGYDTLVGERGARLSGGQGQRLAIARALYRDPDVLVFDEATSALDNLTEKAVMEAVRALGRQKTIILVAHRLTTVRRCDAIYLLDKGRIADSGRYDDLMAANATFRALHEAVA